MSRIEARTWSARRVAYIVLCTGSAAATLYAYVFLHAVEDQVDGYPLHPSWDLVTARENVSVLAVATATAVTAVLIRWRRGSVRIAGIVGLCAATRLVVYLWMV